MFSPAFPFLDYLAVFSLDRPDVAVPTRHTLLRFNSFLASNDGDGPRSHRLHIAHQTYETFFRFQTLKTVVLRTSKPCSACPSVARDPPPMQVLSNTMTIASRRLPSASKTGGRQSSRLPTSTSSLFCHRPSKLTIPFFHLYPLASAPTGLRLCAP